MTMSIEQRCELAAEYLCTLLKLNAPHRTFNLAINGIHVVQISGVYTVVIGGEPAPYAVFTNEKWINMHGKTNPNEGWIQRTIEQAKPLITSIFSGSYSQSDIDELEYATIENSKGVLELQEQRAEWLQSKSNRLNLQRRSLK